MLGQLGVTPIGRPFPAFVAPASEARQHDHAAEDAVEARYLGADGMILQCSHCRRVRGPSPHAWDWIPRFVALPHPNTSHVICPSCVGLWGRRSEGRVRRKK